MRGTHYNLFDFSLYDFLIDKPEGQPSYDRISDYSRFNCDTSQICLYDGPYKQFTTNALLPNEKGLI